MFARDRAPASSDGALEAAPSGEQPTPTSGSEEWLAEDRSRLQRDAVGGTLWTAVQTLIGLPLATVANAVVAHSLGAAQYGRLATFVAVFGIVSAIASFGVNDASVQWIATHRARREADELVAAVRRCAGWHVWVQAPLLGIAAAGLTWQSGWAVATICATAAVFTTIVGTASIVMSGTALNALAARISIVTTVALQSTLVAVSIESRAAGDVFAGRLCASLIGPLLAAVLIPAELRKAVLRPIFPRRWPAGFLPYAARTAAAGLVATLVFSKSEIFLFQAYHREAEAGVFALAAGIAGLITSPIDSILGPLLPAAAALLATKPERAGQALLRGLRTSTLLAGLALAGGVPLLTPLIPVIYGSSYSAATGAFVALAVVSCVQSVNHPIVAFQLGARRTDVVLKVSLVALALDLALAAALIPVWGIAGAVIGNITGQLVSLALSARQVGRMVGLVPRAHVAAMGYFLNAIAVATLGLGVEWLLRNQGPVVQVTGGLLVALLALAVSGRLRPRVGLSAGDVDVIANGLPGPLRRLWRLLVRIFAFQAVSGAAVPVDGQRMR